MDTLIILQQMIVIAFLVLIGYVLYAKKIIDGRFQKQLSVLVADFTNPAMILATIINGKITATRRDLLSALLIAAVIYACLCALGVIVPRFLGVPPEDRRFYHMMTVYTNTGFIGIPLAQAVLPANAMIYVIVFNIMFSVYLYTHGVLVLSGSGRFSFRRFFSPGTIMAVITLLVYWFDITVPRIPANLATYLGNATVFLTMLMLGASIAQQSVRESVKDQVVWRYTVYRMLILPAVMTLIMKQLIGNRDLVQAYCLMLALPAANMPLILAEKEGYPTRTLSRVILVTTLVSFFTITLLLSLLF
ncbi:MAG: AEC family transporter [Eubacterium sp.]|nr:AEC family transporter [Eubacterium sp.]